VRAIEAEARPGLSYRGRRYKVVADIQLGRLRDRDSYEVAGRQDAVAILHALAAESGSRHAELAAHLNEAADLLTPDWRPPRNPEGLVLLRKTIVHQAVDPDLGPALTPSQLKKLGKTHWIEIDLTLLCEGGLDRKAGRSGTSLPTGGSVSECPW
jgi:hypothetical protein